MAGKFNSVGFPDTELIKLYAENVIGEKLDKIHGPKDIVLDPDLMSYVDRIMKVSSLREHNVDKIFVLENLTAPIRRTTKRVYIVKSKPDIMRNISNQINMDREAGIQCQYTILMVPRKLHICEMVLEKEGVYGYVTLDDLPINLIVIDDDILSLESKSFHRNYFLDNDQTNLHEISQSLCDVQNIYGHFDNIFCIGGCSQKVDHLKNLLSLKTERSKIRSKLTSSNQKSGHFTHLIMVDRTVDLVTPLCSQVVYEGLIDDTLNIDCGYVKLGSEITNQANTTKVLLHSKDKLFNEIRDRHFSNVSMHLSAKSKELQQSFEKYKHLDISGTKNFIQNEVKSLMSQRSSLFTHVTTCEFISKKKTKEEIDLLLKVEHSLLEGIDIRDCVTYIEELINRQVEMVKCLNLICLLSITEGGLTSPTYKSLVLQFLQSYGYNFLPSLYNLKRVGLLLEVTNQSVAANLLNRVVSIGAQGAFRVTARRLNLIPRSSEAINLNNPDDMSYVFSGAYSPMLCKIIEQILEQGGFKRMEEVFKLLNVPTKFYKDGEASSSSSPQTKVVLVYFVGGCTYSEIAALRFIAKQRGYTIVVATTSIISSQTFLKSFI